MEAITGVNEPLRPLATSTGAAADRAVAECHPILEADRQRIAELFRVNRQDSTASRGRKNLVPV
jgi:hypothetical protein